jgi:hypothetical protein
MIERPAATKYECVALAALHITAGLGDVLEFEKLSLGTDAE